MSILSELREMSRVPSDNWPTGLMAAAADRIESLERTLREACDEHDRHHAACSAYAGVIVANIMELPPLADARSDAQEGK